MALEFVPIGTSEGYHSLSPPLQVVPVGHFRFIAVRGASGGGVQVHSDNPAVATCSSEGSGELFTGRGGDLLFKINGIRTNPSNQPGKATLTFHHGEARATLRIRVLPYHRVWLNAYLVTDQDEKTTQQSGASVVDMINTCNSTIGLQANIWFFSHSIRSTKVPLAFGHAFADKKAEKEFWKELQNWTPWGLEGSHHWNVFFVRVWAGHDKHKINAIGTNHGDCCVIEDNVGNIAPGLVLAHEACHYLGRKGHSEEKKALMFKRAEGGLYLSWEEIKTLQKRFR